MAERQIPTVREFGGYTWLPAADGFSGVADPRLRALALKAAVAEVRRHLDALEAAQDRTALDLYQRKLGKVEAIARWCGWTAPTLYRRLGITPDRRQRSAAA